MFPTRPAATEACRAERVHIAGNPIKPARDLKPGDEVDVHAGAYFRRYRHLADPPSRVGAKRVPGFCVEVTPEGELDKRREHEAQQRLQRAPGEGRPTKRDRRSLDRFIRKFMDDYAAGKL